MVQPHNARKSKNRNRNMDRRHEDDRNEHDKHEAAGPQDSGSGDDGLQEAEGEDRILKSPEAADYMGISLRHLYAISESGALPRIKIGRSVRYSLADIRRYLESRKNGGGR